MSEYSINWYSAQQKLLGIITNMVSLEYAWAENSIGVMRLTVPSNYYSQDWVARDCFFAIYRDGILQMDTIWFLRKLEYDDTAETLTIIAYSANYLFGDPDNRTGRIVIYDTSVTAYTELQTYADDMIKTIASQNIGLAALDTERDLSTYLSIEANASGGPIVTKSFAKALLLPLFQEICESAKQEDTPVYFDVVCSRLPDAFNGLQLELRTYVGQRGADLREILTVSKDKGNISNTAFSIDYSAEVTVCYAAGSGEGSLQPQEEYTAPKRSVASAFNRREAYIEISSTTDTDALQSAAKEVVAAGKPKLRFSGSLVETPSFRYGVDWKWGDRLKIFSHNYTFDARISAISIKVSQGSEAIEVNLAGETDL